MKKRKSLYNGHLVFWDEDQFTAHEWNYLIQQYGDLPFRITKIVVNGEGHAISKVTDRDQNPIHGSGGHDLEEVAINLLRWVDHKFIAMKKDLAWEGAEDDRRNLRNPDW